MIEMVIWLVLWSWGLTPTWVNIVSTVILSIRLLMKIAILTIETVEKEVEEL